MPTVFPSRPGINVAASCLAIAVAAASISVIAGETCQHPGPASTAPGNNAFACGINNQVIGVNSTAFGRGNEVTGASSMAFGHNNSISQNATTATAIGIANFVSQFNSTAIGRVNEVLGRNSNAFGGSLYNVENGQLISGNYVTGDQSNAFGLGNQVSGTGANGFGVLNVASNTHGNAFGHGNTASGYLSNAFGHGNVASGSFGSAFGFGNVSNGYETTAFGLRSTASNEASTAFGMTSTAGGSYSVAMGYRASTSEAATGALAIGGWYDQNGRDQPTGGQGTATATGVSSVAVGAAVSATGTASAAFGVNATANADYSVAIGYSAIADREYTISVGSATQMNQIANLADGTEDFDAVNLRQMRAADDDLGAGIAAWLGGGAAYAGGVFTAPVYVIQSNNYNDVGSAFGAVDAALTDINQRIVDAGGIQGERGYSAYEVAVQNGYAGTEVDWLGSLQGPTGPGGPQGPEGPAGGGPRSVVYDDDGRDVLTLAGSNGTTIANVADGVAATDAVNVRQMDAGDAATLASAHTYTDTVAMQTLQSANAYTDSRFAAWDARLESIQRGIDDRFHQQDRRIDRQGAMSGAFAGMAMNTAGLSGQNRVGVGVGVQGGEQALAVGYQRAIGNRASVSLGGAFSGNEKSVMGGAGFSW